jgi:hypothetical protein
MNEFFINLVFDNFDVDGNPIPNADHQPSLSSSYPGFLHNTDIFIKNCKIEDVNNTENFYYFINYGGGDLGSLIDKELVISPEAIKACKDNNLKIVFIMFSEVNGDEYNTLNKLINFIKKHKLKEDNFYYINNNGKLNDYGNLLNTHIHLYTASWMLDFMMENMVSHEPVFKSDKEFLFSCHNRVFKKHRLETLCFLKKHNILKNTDWSNLNQHYGDLIQNESDTYFNYDFDFVVDEINFFKKKGIKYSKYETNKKSWLNKEDNGNIVQKLTAECFTNCYINIITETWQSINEIHVSEKSFRPFYFMQLPIFVATHHHVKYLKNRFGFDMFDDLIDHSYDSEPDWKKRMLLVLNEIKRLNDNKDLVIDFYKKNKSRFENNLKIILNEYASNDTIEYFKKIITKKNLNVKRKHITFANIKIYKDIFMPLKCGTRYFEEYSNINNINNINELVSITNIWDYDIKWFVIRKPSDYLNSALKTDFIQLWNQEYLLNTNIDEDLLLKNYVDATKNLLDGYNVGVHYSNKLYKTLYSYALNYPNVKFVKLNDLSDLCLHLYENKNNFKYDSTKYDMMGNYYMDNETITEYVNEFYPSQWNAIQLNLKKEEFFYNKIINNCNFFNKTDYPPIIVNEIVAPTVFVNEIIEPTTIINDEIIVREVIEKNSWLKKIV